MLNQIEKEKYIHFIGIGGVSMSGIAQILLGLGFKISGSDATASETTAQLENSGISVCIGQKAENITDQIGLVVYTAAIKQDNPELAKAREKGILCIERAQMLGELTRLYANTIAICGTHGKTTTTSMISLCFVEDEKEPYVQVGANLRQLGNQNYRIGHSDYFIIEACEYVRSFLAFHPKSVVLLNIEEDHLDYYKNIEDIKSAFHEFLSKVPEDGCIVYNHDDENCQEVVKNQKGHLISFGIKTDGDWTAKSIKLQNGFYSFDAVNKEKTISLTLHVPGYHHIYNALATIALCHYYHLTDTNCIHALSNFTGASRRFEYVGTLNGAKIFDDYAHHPTEIRATIQSAKALPHHKLWIVFQPHTYSRTASLYDEFTTCFEEGDDVTILDIYAAREMDTGIVSSKQLAESINQYSKNCQYISSFEEAADYLKNHVSKDDIILTIGAGSITKLGYEIKDET